MACPHQPVGQKTCELRAQPMCPRKAHIRVLCKGVLRHSHPAAWQQYKPPGGGMGEGLQPSGRVYLRVLQLVRLAVHPAAAADEPRHQRRNLLCADRRPELAAPRRAAAATKTGGNVAQRRACCISFGRGPKRCGSRHAAMSARHALRNGAVWGHPWQAALTGCEACQAPGLPLGPPPPAAAQRRAARRSRRRRQPPAAEWHPTARHPASPPAQRKFQGGSNSSGQNQVEQACIEATQLGRAGARPGAGQPSGFGGPAPQHSLPSSTTAACSIAGQSCPASYSQTRSGRCSLVRTDGMPTAGSRTCHSGRWKSSSMAEPGWAASRNSSSSGSTRLEPRSEANLRPGGCHDSAGGAGSGGPLGEGGDQERAGCTAQRCALVEGHPQGRPALPPHLFSKAMASSARCSQREGSAAPTSCREGKAGRASRPPTTPTTGATASNVPQRRCRWTERRSAACGQNASPMRRAAKKRCPWPNWSVGRACGRMWSVTMAFTPTAWMALASSRGRLYQACSWCASAAHGGHSPGNAKAQARQAMVSERCGPRAPAGCWEASNA